MNKQLQNRLFNQSRKLYNKSGDTYQHFSFILDRNKVVSWGRNYKKKTHPWSAFYGFTYFKIHSELDAIKNLPYPLRQLTDSFTIVNLRLNKKLEFMMAAPCPTCIKLLSFFGFKNVIYTDKFGDFTYL